MNGLFLIGKVFRILVFREICCFSFPSLQSQITCNLRVLLVQRHLTHTVDGVVSVVHNLRHTVLGTLHHHTAAEHTAEVGTLDGVQQTASIDRDNTVLLPVFWIRIFLASCWIGKKDVIISLFNILKQCN